MIFETCQKCGYDLRGRKPEQSPVICPECGVRQVEGVRAAELAMWSKTGKKCLAIGLIPVLGFGIDIAMSKGWAQLGSVMIFGPAATVISAVLSTLLREWLLNDEVPHGWGETIGWMVRTLIIFAVLNFVAFIVIVVIPASRS